MAKQAHKLEAAMRFIYGHFLEEDETLAGFMDSRAHPRPNIRHITRRKLYEVYGCRHEDLSRAEGGFLEEPTPRTTITDSINKKPERFRSFTRAEAAVNRLIQQFDDYWVGMQEYGIRRRLAHYNSMPHHVLAVVACFAEAFGWVDQQKMDGLHTEWQTVSPEMIAREIKKLNK